MFVYSAFYCDRFITLTGQLWKLLQQKKGGKSSVFGQIQNIFKEKIHFVWNLYMQLKGLFCFAFSCLTLSCFTGGKEERKKENEAVYLFLLIKY